MVRFDNRLNQKETEMNNRNTAVAVNSEPKRLITRFADKYHVEPEKLMATLKATAFRQRGNTIVTNEQMMSLLIVANEYGLNPFTKEIFAFDDRGAVIPVVSVDGWARIINEHKNFDGVEFKYDDNIVNPDDGGKPCPAWCEAVIYRKDRNKPTIVREYLDEVYQGPRGDKKIRGPWQTHTKRMLRHKTLIQCARIAFGFAGIYDEDEATRIIDVTPVPESSAPSATSTAAPAPAGRPSRLHNVINKTAPKADPAQDVVDVEAVPVSDPDFDGAEMYDGSGEWEREDQGAM